MQQECRAVLGGGVGVMGDARSASRRIGPRAESVSQTRFGVNSEMSRKSCSQSIYIAD